MLILVMLLMCKCVNCMQSAHCARQTEREHGQTDVCEYLSVERDTLATPLTRTIQILQVEQYTIMLVYNTPNANSSERQKEKLDKKISTHLICTNRKGDEAGRIKQNTMMFACLLISAIHACVSSASMWHSNKLFWYPIWFHTMAATDGNERTWTNNKNEKRKIEKLKERHNKLPPNYFIK